MIEIRWKFHHLPCLIPKQKMGNEIHNHIIQSLWWNIEIDFRIHTVRVFILADDIFTLHFREDNFTFSRGFCPVFWFTAISDKLRNEMREPTAEYLQCASIVNWWRTMVRPYHQAKQINIIVFLRLKGWLSVHGLFQFYEGVLLYTRNVLKVPKFRAMIGKASIVVIRKFRLARIHWTVFKLMVEWFLIEMLLQYMIGLGHYYIAGWLMYWSLLLVVCYTLLFVTILMVVTFLLNCHKTKFYIYSWPSNIAVYSNLHFTNHAVESGISESTVHRPTVRGLGIDH